MNKNIALTILLGVSSIMVNQGKNLVDHYATDMPLTARQIPKSEQLVKEYFQEIDSDTIYAIAFPPANCPRCEAQIIPLEVMIKKKSPNATTVLVSAYPDKNAAQAYNIKHNFSADHFIYDVDEKYKNFLSFSIGYLHVPYLLKIAKSSGKIITAIECEDSSEELVDDLINYKSPLPAKRYETDTKNELLFSPARDLLDVKERFPLSTPDSISISEVYMQPAYGDAGLFFNDKLRYSVLMFTPDSREGKLNFQTEIKTDATENKRFVSVSDTIYNIMCTDNGVSYIPLSPQLVDNTTLAISYSLPKLFKTDHGTIGYMNQAAILTVDTRTLKHKSLFPLLHSHEHFCPHFAIYATPNDIITGCKQLTWPLEFDREEYESDPENNPFDDAFYLKSNPIMASFGIGSWKLERLFGQLPEHAKRSKTGHYFCDYIFDYHKGEAAWSDAASGVISICDTIDYNNTTNQYIAFTIPECYIKEPDPSLFYSYDCTTAYKSVFCRKIIDLKLSDNKIYCVVRYGDFNEPNICKDIFTYVEISRDTGIATEKRFPVICDNIPLAYGLRKSSNGEVSPYSVFRDKNSIFVELYYLE